MSLLREELTLRIDRELRYQMDEVIMQMHKKAKEFGIGKVAKERSPLRNVLLVASDPTASLEVIKTYIRYQTGRKDGSEVWKLLRGNQRFADAVIVQLEELETTAKNIFEEIQRSISEFDQHPLKSYFQTPEYKRDIKDLHLRLAQLYLGSLVREHVALVAEAGNNSQKPGEENNFNQSKPDSPSKAFERPSKPQKRN